MQFENAPGKRIRNRSHIHSCPAFRARSRSARPMSDSSANRDHTPILSYKPSQVSKVHPERRSWLTGIVTSGRVESVPFAYPRATKG